jgi:hypothetical protein
MARRKAWRWALGAVVLVLIIAGAAGTGNHKPRDQAPSGAATTASTATTSTVGTAHAGNRQPRKRKTVRRAVHVAGLLVSSASGDVVQPQPPPGSCHARGSGALVLPDPRCTPGAVNPDVTPATIGQTICVSGWTSTVRPSESVTHDEKLASMAAYADAGSSSTYEYDHLVPLELGGAVNDPHNLWPEPGGVPNPKDPVENALHRAVCSNQMPLRQAQHIIATDWRRYAASARSTRFATTTTTTAPTTTRPSPAPNSSPPTVHPGAFCAPEGSHGITVAGTPMVCGPASDGRNRWHSG